MNSDVRPHRPLFSACAQGSRKPHASAAHVVPPATAAVSRFLPRWRPCLATAGRGVALQRFLSCMRSSVWLSFFAFLRCGAPAIPRVPRAGNYRPRQPSSPWQALCFTRGYSSVCASFQRRFSSLTRLRYPRFPCPCTHHRLTRQSSGTPNMPPFSEQAASRGAPYFYVRQHRPLFSACAHRNRKPHGSVTQAIPPATVAGDRFLPHQPRCSATAGREVVFQRLLSCIRPNVGLSFFAFHRCCAPATARVPRGRNGCRRRPLSPRQALRLPRGNFSACASFQRSFSSPTRLRYPRFPCPCTHHRLTRQSSGTPNIPPFSDQATSRGAPYFYVSSTSRPHPDDGKTPYVIYSGREEISPWPIF